MSICDFEDDDLPALNSSALAALQEFYHERDTREKQFEDLKAAAENEFDDSKPLSMSLFTESWQDSQFWYSDQTATVLAEQLLDGATSQSRIAVVSAPSVYIQLRNLLSDRERYPSRPKLTLFEFDERFAVFKDDFVPYDFKQPLKLDVSLKGTFDRIIVDPPFLSDECQTKAALTVRWLAKSWTGSPASGSNDAATSASLKLISCTGERMESLIHKLYGKTGLDTTDFYPEHSNNLSNEFLCYANFECKSWKWRSQS
ncbi:hypothetical protein MBLNU459_g6722t2 [Dothideomycetes sp. NU459]